MSICIYEYPKANPPPAKSFAQVYGTAYKAQQYVYRDPGLSMHAAHFCIDNEGEEK